MRGGFCHRRSATKPIVRGSGPEMVQGVTQRGANTYLEAAEKVAVNGTKPHHHICVSVTHAGVRGNELKVAY